MKKKKRRKLCQSCDMPIKGKPRRGCCQYCYHLILDAIRGKPTVEAKLIRQGKLAKKKPSGRPVSNPIAKEFRSAD